MKQLWLQVYFISVLLTNMQKYSVLVQQDTANMQEIYCMLLKLNFTGTVCEDELITSSNNKGYCHTKCFFFLFNENEINLLYFC